MRLSFGESTQHPRAAESSPRIYDYFAPTDPLIVGRRIRVSVLGKSNFARERRPANPGWNRAHRRQVRCAPLRAAARRCAPLRGGLRPDSTPAARGSFGECGRDEKTASRPNQKTGISTAGSREAPLW
jgi:hypothetical protein